MPTNSPFPLDILEKVNLPELVAFFAQFGEQFYLSAEDVNKMIQGMQYLYENIDPTSNQNLLQLGENSTTAYRGDRGKAAYDFATNNANVFSNAVNALITYAKIISSLGFTPEDASKKGAALGYPPLDSNIKIPNTYLSDSILGQVLYGGTFNPSTGVATLTANAKAKLNTNLNSITLTNNTNALTGYLANQGIFYITRTVNDYFAGIEYKVGDWLVSTNTAWDIIDNTDALISFNNRIGAITLLLSDVTTALGFTPVSITEIKTTNFTAEFDKNYVITGSAKITNPTGVAGKRYSFTVSGASTVVTIGSLTFGAGSRVEVIFNSSFQYYHYPNSDDLVITTSSNIDTSPDWNGRVVKINNGSNNITVTINHSFTCSGTKSGTGNIIFANGSQTVWAMSGILTSAGNAGSLWAITKRESATNTVNIYINNL